MVWYRVLALGGVDASTASGAVQRSRRPSRRTLELPVSESFNKNVNFELRNGTCDARRRRADTTSPRALSDRLMCCASFSIFPLASVLNTRSEPYVTVTQHQPHTCRVSSLSRAKPCVPTPGNALPQGPPG